MIIYPAIDLRQGQVVRLREGNLDALTHFSSDPVETARRWIDQGAAWLHVVNLDGAFGEQSVNLTVLKKITRLGVPVQFGGGIRTSGAIQQAFDYGATRIVIGTAAIEQPDLVITALQIADVERVAIGLDAKNGMVATRGWQQVSEKTPVELGLEMAKLGIKHALFTDVSKDGRLEGSSVQDTIALAETTSLQVIASGGITRETEIVELASSGKVAGAVIGMALYEGRLSLEAALESAKGMA